MRVWDKLALKLNKGLYIMFGSGFYSFCYCSVGKGYQTITKKNPGKDNEKIENWVIDSLSLEQCLSFDLKSKQNYKNIFLLEVLYDYLH